ncbi:uncharacterized protein [Medicago truncatula]|uniref:uncharacterized protein isoform X2 n=1 Tax=Medicago truncatula TaxID=3880 RepID=UPI000D2F233B|nr:uncharacterized protein LOC25494245 isoform X2 [Medicago truncatula]
MLRKKVEMETIVYDIHLILLQREHLQYTDVWEWFLSCAKRRDSMEIQKKRTAHRLHKSKAAVEVPPEPSTSSVDLNYEDFLVPATMPMEVRAPIPDEQQREVFKWILEEKRKVKPKDAMEKKQIDEDKDILKQFLRANSIPKF